MLNAFRLSFFGIKMKILFINHNIIWRGSFYRCLGFARELINFGNDVQIWSVSNKYSLKSQMSKIDGVTIWTTPRWRPLGKHDGGYAPVDIANRMIKSFLDNWDIIHAFEHRLNVFLPWITMYMKRKIFGNKNQTIFMSDWSDCWAGGGIISKKRRFKFLDRCEQYVEEKSKLWANGTTVISSVLFQRARMIGIKDKHLLYLPSGTRLDQFSISCIADCRMKLSLPIHSRILGFIGFSLWDMNLLAKSFAIIKEKMPDVILLIIGGGVEEQSLNIFRKNYAIDRDIILTGVIPFNKVPIYLGACDILLLPMENNLANQARVPNKLMDYYAAGRPVVTSKVGDAGEWIELHHTGLAAGEGEQSFADACITMLQYKEWAEECGKKARRLAETEFSYKNLTEKLIHFYDTILKERSAN